jgi:hypothetical protein
MKNIKPIKPFAIIVLISIAYFVAALIALHFLESGINPIRDATSEYVNGPYGSLMTSAFFSISIACLTLAYGLYLAMPFSTRPRTGLLLIAFFGLVAIVVMFFPVNLQGAALTISGLVHRIIGPVGFLCTAVGTILISRSFKKDNNFRTLYKPALVLSWVILVMFFAIPASMATKSGLAGLGQRILLATLVAWIILIAARLCTIDTKNRVETGVSFN